MIVIKKEAKLEAKEMKFRILWTRKPAGLTVFKSTIRARSIDDAKKKFANSKEGKTANLQSLNIITEKGKATLSKVKFIVRKRAGIVLKELGAGLKRMFKTIRVDDRVYLFQIATFSKLKADKFAEIEAKAGRDVHILKDGRLFTVYATGERSRKRLGNISSGSIPDKERISEPRIPHRKSVRITPKRPRIS